MEIHPWRCIQVSQVQVYICSCPWFWYPTIYPVSSYFLVSTTAEPVPHTYYCRVSNFMLSIPCSTVFIFVLALVGVFYPYNRGALFTALVVIYALTSGIAGYIATSFYCQLEGTSWVRACYVFILEKNYVLVS